MSNLPWLAFILVTLMGLFNFLMSKGERDEKNRRQSLAVATFCFGWAGGSMFYAIVALAIR